MFPPKAAVLANTSSSTISVPSSTQATSPSLPTREVKQVKAAAILNPIPPSSQQRGMSTNRVELPAEDSPVMTKAQYAAVPLPKSDPEVSRGSVMLDAPIKYGSPYMPVGRPKENPPRPAAATREGHASNGIVFIETPASPPNAPAAPAKPAITQTPKSKPPTPLNDGHVSSGIVLIDIPAKPSEHAVAPPKPMSANVPPAESGTKRLEPVKPVTAPVTILNAKNPATDTAGSYVSNGVVIVESKDKVTDSQPKRAPLLSPKPIPPDVPKSLPAKEQIGNKRPGNQAPALLALQKRLQQRIAAVCKKPAKDVEVTARYDKNVHILVKAATTQEAETLSGKVLQLPELEPFEVSLDIAVGP